MPRKILGSLPPNPSPTQSPSPPPAPPSSPKVPGAPRKRTISRLLTRTLSDGSGERSPRDFNDENIPLPMPQSTNTPEPKPSSPQSKKIRRTKSDTHLTHTKHAMALENSIGEIITLTLPPKPLTPIPQPPVQIETLNTPDYKFPHVIKTLEDALPETIATLTHLNSFRSDSV